jgi:TolB-like protein/Flp pilus assembly protein TadD
MSAERYEFGPFVLDATSGTLMQDGAPIALGNRGMALLLELLRAKDQVVAKAALMDAAWPNLVVEESNLSVQIAALRKLLGASPTGGEWIRTVPRVGYRLIRESGRDGTASPRAIPPGRGQKPTIAVFPLLNASTEPQQDYFAGGLTDDIIKALGRFRWFSVIGPNSDLVQDLGLPDAMRAASDRGVRYLLQGSLRKSDQRMRVSVQLIDAGSGIHIWDERYDVEMAEVFAIQDAIAERVAGAIEPELLKTEAALAASRKPGNMSAWDLVRQGTERFHRLTQPTHFQARELFREACRVDPNLAEAHSWLARVSAGVLAYGWSASPEADREEGLRAAFAGIRLDDRNPYSHYGLAIISVYGGDLDQATRAAEKAVELSPSFALGNLVLGMARLFSGAASGATASLERGLQLHAFDPQNFIWLNLLALARLLGGQHEAALDAAIQAVRVRPDWRPSLESLACCYFALGREQEARRCVQEAAELSRPSSNALQPLMQRNPQWAELIERMLRKARIDS